MRKIIPPYRLKYTKKSIHQYIYDGEMAALEEWIARSLDINVRDKNGQTLLHAAVHGNHPEMVKLLLGHGADVNACSDEVPYHTNPIQTAVYNGLLDIVELLIAHGADITVKTDNQCTLLHLAVFNNHLDVAEYLLAREADIDDPADNGVTPLYSATMHGMYEMSKLLLEAGADPNAASDRGFTPLFDISSPEIVRELVKYGADINKQDYHGESPIFYVNSLEAFEEMLNSGARLDIVSDDGNTLLHHAASSIWGIQDDAYRIAELFIERAMDINVRNRKGQTPLKLAIKAKNVEFADFLREHGGVC